MEWLNPEAELMKSLSVLVMLVGLFLLAGASASQPVAPAKYVVLVRAAGGEWKEYVQCNDWATACDWLATAPQLPGVADGAIVRWGVVP